jgi:hypothetical protein
VTAIVRGDRFADGMFVDAVLNGTIPAALDRIRHFVDGR